MTLLEYITDLQSQVPALAQDVIFERAQAWKSKNQPIEEVDEEIVKKKVVADQAGAAVTTTTKKVSEQEDAKLKSEDSTSEYATKLFDFLNQRIDRFAKDKDLSKDEYDKREVNRKKYVEIAGPEEVITKDQFDYKYDTDGVYYYKPTGSKDKWKTYEDKKSDGNLAIASEFGHFEYDKYKKLKNKQEDFDVESYLEVSEDDENNANSFNPNTAEGKVIIKARGKDSTQMMTEERYNEFKKSATRGGVSVKWENPNWKQEAIENEAAKPMDSKIADFIVNNKLNENNIHKGFKDQVYSGEYAEDFRETIGVDTINSDFDLAELNDIEGWNSDNFIGFMNANGYTDDYLDAKYNPKQGYDLAQSPSNTYTTLEDKLSSKVNQQRKQSRYFDLYIDEQEDLYRKKLYTSYIKKNPGEFKDVKSLDEALTKAAAYFDEKYEGNYGFFNYGKIKKYKENVFPDLTEANAILEAEKAERINKIKAGENLSGDLYIAAKKAQEGYISGAENIAFGIKDLLGFDNTFRNASLEEREVKRSAESVRYQYVEGKKATVNDITYIKDENGNIYDITNKTILGAVTQGELKNINSALDSSDETGSSYSGLGSLQEFSGVAGRMAFDIVSTMVTGGGTKALGLAKYAKIVKLPKASLDAMTYYTASGYFSTKRNTYNELVNAGLNNEDAEEISETAGRYGGALLGITSLISPQTAYMKNLNKTIYGKSIVSKALEGYKQKGKNGAISNVLEIFKNLKPTKAGIVKAIDAGSKEFAQENIQQVSELEVLNKYINKLAGSEVLDEVYTRQKFINTSITATASGSAFANLNIRDLGQRRAKQQIQSLYQIGNDLENSKKVMNEMVVNGIVTQEEVSKVLSDVRAVNNQMSSIPDYVSSETQIESAKIQQEIADLQTRKKNINEVFHENIDIKIDNAKGRLAEIVKPELEKALSRKGAKTMADQLDSSFETFTDQEKIDNRAKELESKGAKVQKSTGYGQAIDMSGVKDYDGPKTIILINDQISAEDNVYTTGQHEILHPFWQKTFKDNPKLAIQFGKSIMQEIISNPEIQVGPIILSRFKQYLSDPNYSAENTWEEVIPLLSESLSRGDVVYNKKQEGWWKSIASKITNLFKKAKKPLNITFDTGKDAFDFVLGYNKTIEAGKGFTEQQLQISKEGAKGKLVDTAVDIDLDAEIKAKKEIETGADVADGDLVDIKPKESKRESSEQAERNKELMQKAKDGDITASKDLVQENSGLILRLLGFNKDIGDIEADALLQAVTDMATPGMVDLVFPGRKKSLVEEYNPSLDKEVSTFLGRLTKRKAELYTAAGLDPKKFETESLSSPEARQIADKKVLVDKKPDVIEKKQTDVREFKPVKDKLKKLNEIIQIKDGEKVSFKELNTKHLDEVAGEVLNLSSGKVSGNKTLNYKEKIIDGIRVPSDVNTIQGLFNKTKEASDFIKTIPEFNIATSETIINEQGEVIDVSKDIKGKALGINPKIIKTLYEPYIDPKSRSLDKNIKAQAITDKSGRSKGKTVQTPVFRLKPEFRGKISLETVLKLQKLAGITPSGELTIPLKGKARTEFGTVLQGLAKIYVGNVINTIGRSKITSKQGKADLGAGKSKSMASKRFQIPINGQNGIETLRDNYNAFADKNNLKVKFEEEEINVDNLDADNPTHKKWLKNAIETELFKYIPIDFFNSANLASAGNKLHLVKKYKQFFTGKERRAILKIAKENLAEFEKENGKVFTKDQLIDVSRAVAKEGFVKDPYKYGTTKYQERIDSAFRGEALILQGFANAIKANAKNALPIFAFFSTQASSSGHFVRQFAVARGITTEAIESKQNTKEHVDPANDVGPLMFESTLLDAVGDLMPFIKEMYYQLSITNTQDNGLADTSGQNGTAFTYKKVQVPSFIKIFQNALDKNDVSLISRYTPLLRYLNELVSNNFNPIDGQVPFNTNTMFIDGKNVGAELTFELPANQQTADNVIRQNEISMEVIAGTMTRAEGKKALKTFIPIGEANAKASKRNSERFSGKVFPGQSIEGQVKTLQKYDTTLELSRSLTEPTKGISVFDFDDTLAKTNSKVIVTMPSGKTTKIDATKFAAESVNLENEGAIFDFSEFNKVIDGKKGPLADLALKRQGKFGSGDIFVLTARPQAAAEGIKMFLDGIGLNLPLENITGLEDGSPEAKANWVIGKTAKGYNDFYFADDAVKNVKAVKEILEQVDVKSKVQVAKSSKRITFDKIFNNIIEDATGIESYKEYSPAKAQTVGANKGRRTFFTTPSAEDFNGLLYKLLGKGKKGDAQMAFLKTNLIDPYNRAEIAVTQAKIAAANDFKALKKNLKTLPKSLSKETGIGGFTFGQAARVAIWTRQGMTVPGLSKTDAKKLNAFVESNPELNIFTNELINIQKGKAYPKPGKSWLAGTITSDIINEINKVNRKEYLQEWQENVDIIFSDKNISKLEAAYGPRYIEALKDNLARMKSGSNRPIGGSRVVNNLLDWLNNSVGAVMFLNTRSAVLQTISAINFINWGDNNILKAGKAFANQKQYWGDFMTLFNSPYLTERRDGLKINVSESEIADAVSESTNKPKAFLSLLLNKGFIMTRIADSFAIAAGGSTFYRNRMDALVKSGMDPKAAEKQAFDDFYAIAETNQQSSNPSKISQQQASAAGRVILAFANTPMQYNRIIKRSSQDLINGRGDWRANVSKIVYYAAIQNLVFNALQNALFAAAFEDDDDEEDKTGRIANGMADSLIRGFGIQGAAAVAVKDALITINKEATKEKGSPEFDKALFDLFGFSPPLDSKVRKIRSGLNTFSWQGEEINEEGFNLNNPAYLASAQVIAAGFNIPLDRAIQKINNLRNVVSDRSENWQKVALTMGWSTWDVGLPYYGIKDKEVETPQTILRDKVAVMKKETNTKEQKLMLLDLGLTKQQIKALKYEEIRIKKIIELQNKKKGNGKK